MVIGHELTHTFDDQEQFDKGWNVKKLDTRIILSFKAKHN
jgi:predicted metalloendopeptidase